MSHSFAERASVSNLTPSWERDVVLTARDQPQSPISVLPPAPSFAMAVEASAEQRRLGERASAYELLAQLDQDPTQLLVQHESMSMDVDHGALHAHAERHVETVLVPERRSAYEIVFILLAAAVSLMLAAPVVVQMLLAARGIQS